MVFFNIVGGIVFIFFGLWMLVELLEEISFGWDYLYTCPCCSKISRFYNTDIALCRGCGKVNDKKEKVQRIGRYRISLKYPFFILEFKK